MAGSLRALTPPTCRTPGHYSTNWPEQEGAWSIGLRPLHARFNFWFLPSIAILGESMRTVKWSEHERENMPPIPTDNLDLLERVAVAQARQ
jgi:hypothetical protein